MIDFRAISWRFTRVWRRNLITYRKIWKVSFLTPLLEPLLFVTAFGRGLFCRLIAAGVTLHLGTAGIAHYRIGG